MTGGPFPNFFFFAKKAATFAFLRGQQANLGQSLGFRMIDYKYYGRVGVAVDYAFTSMTMTMNLGTYIMQ